MISNFWRRQSQLMICLACSGGLWLVSPTASAASLTGKDVQIIAKALGFLEPAPPGGTLAVVYSASDPASKADADAIAALFGEGITSRGGTVQARSIDVAAFGDGSGYIAVVAASGVTGAGVITAVKARHFLCITAAMALVQSGQCVMAVRSDPKVEITVNRDAAESAKVVFGAAFRMLIKEI